ncbi:E3 ubiquitin/ISG15 ligase TRIM25-like isoform X2 [Paramisgurnus dabryanus]|uniref:E3 ubiquitin/ISG15 ligase TRIM25-like isoform X2 n=1 Tax=Paramisgurnus dabryanus TaxID=90735 RepID=UPI0031F4656E
MTESSSTSPRRRRRARRLSIIEPPLMSSSNNQELQCIICLDVFNDPVSTPCGHNFCKICLNTYWDNSEDCMYPNCKETFEKRPELKINTTLRNLVDEHKKKTEEKQPEVLCDICEEVKLKAVKSCVVCQSSYCETHLGRHLTVTGLKKHKLIDPVNNLLDYICQKHERPLELFCRDDQTPVCLSCTDGDHKNHDTVTLEEEIEERKIELLKTQTDVQQNIRNKTKKIQDIKHSVELRGKSAKKQDEDLIKDLEQKIIVLKRRYTELENIINTKDPLGLIRVTHLKGYRCQQRSPSELFEDSSLWIVVGVAVLFVLFCCYLQAHIAKKQSEAENPFVSFLKKFM